MKPGPTLRLPESLVRYAGVAAASFKEKLAYRFDFFTASLLSLVTAALLSYLWRAVYRSSVGIEMPLETLITYVCVGQAISMTRLSWLQRRSTYQASGKILSGDIIIDLARPLDYQLLQLSDAVGFFFSEMLFINIPSYILFLVVFGIDLPVSPEAAVGFVISLLGAFLLMFSLNYLVAMAAFWTYSALGLIYAKRAIVDILAGSLIPLSLFPQWLKGISEALPFQGIAYVPLSIYIGTIRGSQIWLSILKQFAWALAMMGLMRLIWARASRRITIHGG
jgi:ABC-2 type transport system permease protein